MNVYVWYDVILMFVNDVVCDRDIIYSVKEIPALRLLGCALFGDSIYLRRYPDSTGTLDSYRWRLSVSEESKEVHMTISEVWNMSLSKSDIWINHVHMVTVPEVLNKSIRAYQDRLCPRFEIWARSEQMDSIWQVQTSKSNSIHESFKSRESSVFVCESVYV